MTYDLTIESKYKKNASVLSVKNVKDMDLYGISLKAPNLPAMIDESISFYIAKAVSSLEDALTIRFLKQIINETLDYDRQSSPEWFFIKTTFPVREVVRLEGSYGMNNQGVVTTVPPEYITVRRTNNPEVLPRMVHIVQNNLPITWTFNYTYATNLYSNQNHIPSFWKIQYCTGFDTVPDELIRYIGMSVALDLLSIYGDVLFGAGVSNASVAIDGLSQSIGTTKSATRGTFGGRIAILEKQMPTALEGLRATYRGISVAFI